jgi:hypothetical protein
VVTGGVPGEAPNGAPGALALMRLHVEALFTHDAAGRLLRVNEPGGAPAPRFFLGRTAEGRVCRLRHDVDDALARALLAACRDAPGEVPHDATHDAAHDAPREETPYEALLARAAPVERRWAGPAYRFPDALPDVADVVRVTDANAHLLDAHLAPWREDVALGRPLFARLVGGAAVAVCASVRTTAAADEAGVETARALRGQGHAAPVVAAWARAVRAVGRVPLYSTSWENAASRAVARKLGLVRFGSDLHFT